MELNMDEQDGQDGQDGELTLAESAKGREGLTTEVKKAEGEPRITRIGTDIRRLLLRP